MTTSFLLLLASSLPSSPNTDGQSPFDHALTDQSAWVVRAQSPSGPTVSGGPLVGPPQGVQTYYPPATPIQQTMPGVGGTVEPFANPTTPVYPSPLTDPWSGAAAPPPYAVPAPNPGFYTYGMNGAQPIRFGWQARYDVTWIPNESTSSPSSGKLGIFGADFVKQYTAPIWGTWVWSAAPEFNYRSYQGPIGTPTTDLPPDAYRFALPLTLQTPTVDGWTLEAGFTPQLAADFNSTLTSDAWMFDGQVIAFWQATPQWMWSLGVLYWDRVDDIILPTGGAVWTPNDLWEFRLLFPKSRISVFVGAPWGVPTWLYVSGEYHVEAYQMQPDLLADETRVQFKDWRVMGGARWEAGWFSSFVEAGYVFSRDVQYARLGTKYDVDPGFIARAGFRY